MIDMPNVLTDKEVAIYLKLSPKWGHVTVQRLARSGRIKGVKVGHLWRFNELAIRDFMNRWDKAL